MEEKYDGIFYAIYTTETQQHAIGSLALRIGDVLIAGQSFAAYGYGYPLNIKNVLCLWGGILAIGFSLCNITGVPIQEISKTKGYICCLISWGYC